MKDIAIFGAGGHCYAVVELIKSLGQWNPIVIYDDQPREATIFDIPVKKFSDQDTSPAALCITIGNNLVRKQIAARFESNYPSFIHATAAIYPSAIIGQGSVILPNAVVDAAVQLGDFCIVNNNATVSHNAEIGNFCHIAINVAVAGGVKIGECSLVGAGSVVLPEVKIGKHVTIGAGAVVTKDVPDNAIVYGNPARIIKYNE